MVIFILFLLSHPWCLNLEIHRELIFPQLQCIVYCFMCCFLVKSEHIWSIRFTWCTSDSDYSKLDQPSHIKKPYTQCNLLLWSNWKIMPIQILSIMVSHEIPHTLAFKTAYGTHPLIHPNISLTKQCYQKVNFCCPKWREPNTSRLVFPHRKAPTWSGSFVSGMGMRRSSSSWNTSGFISNLPIPRAPCNQLLTCLLSPQWLLSSH